MRSKPNRTDAAFALSLRLDRAGDRGDELVVGVFVLTVCVSQMLGRLRTGSLLAYVEWLLAPVLSRCYASRDSVESDERTRRIVRC